MTRVYKWIGLFMLSIPLSLLAQEKEPVPHVKFRTLVDTTEIIEGGCVRVIFTILVNDMNEASVQFKDAGQELFKVLGKFKKLNALFFDEHLDDIQGVPYRDAYGSYTRYDVWRGSICPMGGKEFTIPSYEFNLEKIYQSDSSALPLNSLPKIIKINPLDSIYDPQVHSTENIKMVGSFEFEEQRLDTDYAVHERISFGFEIKGEGIGSWIDLHMPEASNTTITINDIQYSDTLINDRLTFSKKFDVTLHPKESGLIDLSEIFQWTYFSDKENGLKTIGSNQKLNILSSEERSASEVLMSSTKTNTLICLDISESMQIEDYRHNRLAAAISIVKKIREQIPQAELVGYSGSIHNIENIDIGDSLFHLAHKRGTSLGDMVWQSVERLKTLTIKNRVIMIGDGDGTSGSMDELFATQFAKRESIVIHTIGIGHTGKVPFGKDFFGRSNYVENTYNDNSLRMMAEMTGGSFHYLENNEDIDDLVANLLKAIKE